MRVRIPGGSDGVCCKSAAGAGHAAVLLSSGAVLLVGGRGDATGAVIQDSCVLFDPATDPTRVSTTLFDTVAVYLAARDELLRMAQLPLRVTEDGFTVVDEDRGRPVNCAIGWQDLDAFRDELVETLLG